MGLKSLAKKAGKLGSAPVIGAYKGLVVSGSAPAANTVRGAAKGNKKDLAIVAATTAAAIPAASIAGKLFKGEQTASRFSVAARSGAKLGGEVAPHIRAAARFQRAGETASAGLTMGQRARYIAGPSRAAPGLGDSLSTGKPLKKNLPTNRWVSERASNMAARLSSERGSLDYDKYMGIVRDRFKRGGLMQLAPKAGSGKKALGTGQIMSAASKNVPDGMVMGAAARLGQTAVSKGRVDTIGSVTNALKTTDRELAGERAADAIRRTWNIKGRMETGGGGTLRGFYEKIKGEEGMLKFPAKPGGAVGRMKNRVWNAIYESAEVRSPGAKTKAAAAKVTGELKALEARDAVPEDKATSMLGFIGKKAGPAAADKAAKRMNTVERALKGRAKMRSPMPKKGEAGYLKLAGTRMQERGETVDRAQARMSFEKPQLPVGVRAAIGTPKNISENKKAIKLLLKQTKKFKTAGSRLPKN